MTDDDDFWPIVFNVRDLISKVLEARGYPWHASGGCDLVHRMPDGRYISVFVTLGDADEAVLN